jgi:hypothetical protein
VKLDDGKIRCIIRAREKGNSSKDIAYSLSVSTRRVEQVYSHYRLHGEVVFSRNEYTPS